MRFLLVNFRHSGPASEAGTKSILDDLVSVPVLSPSRKPGTTVTNSARQFTPREKDSISGFKSGCHRRVGGHLTDLKKMDVY